MKEPINPKEHPALPISLSASVIAGLLTLCAVVIHLYAQRHPYYALLTSLGAIVLYSCAYFLPYRLYLIALCLFPLGYYAPLAEPITSIRILVFAIALAGIHRSRPTLPPIISFSALWFLFLLATITTRSFGLSFINNQLLVPPVDHLIVSLLSESVGILIIGLLLFSPRVYHLSGHLFGRSPLPLNSQVYFVHLLVLTVVFCLMLFGAALLYATGTSSANLIMLFLRHQPVASIVLCGLIVLPVVVGLFLARSIARFVTILVLASDDQSLHYTNHGAALFSELKAAYRAIQANIHKLTARIREEEEVNRALRIDSRNKDKEIADQEIQARNLVKQVNALPWGMICCSSGGVIVSANEEALRLLQQGSAAVIGKHIAALDAGHPWQKDVVALLAQGCRELQRAVPLPATKSYSSPNGYHYLELTLIVHTSAVRDRHSAELLSTETLVMLFIRKLPDLRDFLLRLLAPTTLEIVGSQAIEFSKLVRNQLGVIVGNSSIIDGVLRTIVDTNGRPVQQSERGLEVATALRKIDEIARAAAADLKKLEDQQAIQSENVVRVNVTLSFETLLRFFEELLMPYQTTKIHFTSEGSRPDLHDSLPPAPSTTIAGDAFLTVPESELTKFYAYLLSFMKSIMPKTSDIYISVGHETLGSEMLHIIPGSHPGQYVRFTIRHGGQSVTANMMTGKFYRLQPNSKVHGETEQALSLLQLQTTRLSGFITVQSTVSKGTFITIYLPVKRDVTQSHLSRPQKSQKPLLRKPLTPLNVSMNHVLLIGTDEHTLTIADSMLRHLGFEVQIQQTPFALEELNAPLEFMGSGFNPSSEDRSARLQQSANHPFQMIIVNIESTSRELINLIHHLERQNPDSSLLLIIEPNDETKTLFGDWATVTKPFDVEMLTSAMKDAHARN